MFYKRLISLEVFMFYTLFLFIYLVFLSLKYSMCNISCCFFPVIFLPCHYRLNNISLNKRWPLLLESSHMRQGGKSMIVSSEPPGWKFPFTMGAPISRRRKINVELVGIIIGRERGHSKFNNNDFRI